MSVFAVAGDYAAVFFSYLGPGLDPSFVGNALTADVSPPQMNDHPPRGIFWYFSLLIDGLPCLFFLNPSGLIYDLSGGPIYPNADSPFFIFLVRRNKPHSFLPSFGRLLCLRFPLISKCCYSSSCDSEGDTPTPDVLLRRVGLRFKSKAVAGFFRGLACHLGFLSFPLLCFVLGSR